MIDIKCKHCDRWLGKTDQTLIATIKCSNSKCKLDNNIKIVNSNSSEAQLRYKFKQEEEVKENESN